MTQSDQPRRDDYVGNGSLTDFVYTFEINNKSHIDVTLIDVDINSVVTRFPQILDVDYEVQGVGESGGGTIVFIIDPPVAGIFIVLEGDVPFDQNTVFIEGSPFPAKAMENALDKLTQQVQQLRDRIDATLRTPTLPDFTDGQLPDGVAALDILQINETLDGFTSNSISAVFDSGALTAHQLDQLDNIGPTTTIITSQWDFVGLMDQGVATGDAVTFASVNGATNLPDLAALTSAEIAQLDNIDSAVITTSNWSFVSSLDQNLGMSDAPEFAGLTVGGESVGTTVIRANQNFKTGSVETGNLSIASATEFNVSAGSGIVVDYFTDVLDPVVTEVSWSAFSNVTLLNIGVGTLKTICIDINGDIVQKDGVTSRLDLRDLIVIGAITHTATDITLVVDAPAKVIGEADLVADLISVLGTLNKSGNVYSANGANLNMNKTLGESFGTSINAVNSEKFANITTDAAQVALFFVPAHRDGSGGVTLLPATDTVDPGFFDDGSGTLAPVSANRAANHRIVFDPRSGFTIFLYGQQDYNSIGSATAAVPDAFELPGTFDPVISFRSILSARGGAGDLSISADAQFTEITPTITSGATTSIQAASLQTAYDQGSSIGLDGVNSIDLEANSDTDNLIRGLNSSSIITSALTGEGDFITFGRISLDGIAHNDIQLQLTANTAQTGRMFNVRDFAGMPIFGVTEDSTLIDKLLEVNANQEINNVDVNEEALHITSAAGQISKVIKIDDNSGTELLSLDDAGQFLIKGAEIESGGGENVLHYAEFNELSTTNFVDIPIPSDPTIVAMRIEIRDLKMGVPAGSVKDGLAILFATVEDGGTFKEDAGNYGQRTITNLTTSSSISNAARLRLEPMAAGAVSIFVISQSYIIDIFNFPDNLEDQMYVGLIGKSRNNTAVEDLVNHSMSGACTSIAGEETETINKLRIQNTFNATPNWTSGSIKVIGIKSGGPSF